MESKKMDFGSKDIINTLPEPLICQILSCLPTKEAALTSLLSKKWRYLFGLAPNLEFDCSAVYQHKEGNVKRDDIHRMFTEFVDRVLGLQGNYTINKFSLKFGLDVEPVCIIHWILNVLERGISDLDLRLSMYPSALPSKVFMSKSLVRLKIESKYVSRIDVEDVFLPKLKTLYLDKVMLVSVKADDCFDKLISGCHVLEELVLINVYNNTWNYHVSSKTVKRLRLHGINPKSDSVSYWIHQILSTWNTLIMLRSSDLVANAKDFLMGVCNVQILHLTTKTLEVLALCCEPIPVFNNLIHLTIKTHREVGWESLATLLKNCPNLGTLVFKGLNQKNTIKCAHVDGCVCKSSVECPTCLSSSPVKVVKILKFGENFYDYDNMEMQMELVEHFLKTMPKLEQMILYYDTPFDEDVIKVFKQLEMLPRVASANCKIQIISDTLSL